MITKIPEPGKMPVRYCAIWPYLKMPNLVTWRYMPKTFVDHGEVSGAELYLNKLTKDFPNAAATVILQAEVMARRNQYEEALDLMKSFVDREKRHARRPFHAHPPHGRFHGTIGRKAHGTGSKNYGRTLCQNGGEYLRQYVDEHPSQVHGFGHVFPSARSNGGSR